MNVSEEEFTPRVVLERISAAKSGALTPDDLAARATSRWFELVADLYRHYESDLRAQDALDQADHPVELGPPFRVPLEQLVSIGKLEHVDGETRQARQGVAAQNVHAEVGEHAADVREQKRLVERHDRQLPRV